MEESIENEQEKICWETAIFNSSKPQNGQTMKLSRTKSLKTRSKVATVHLQCEKNGYWHVLVTVSV